MDRAGTRLYLVVVDGRSAKSTGLTLAELSALVHRLGAADGVNLDGGGSSTFAVRPPGASAPTVRNNAIGVFAHL